MTAVGSAEAEPRFWSEEPSSVPGQRRIRARIGGLHCSLCTGTIEKALGRRPGVNKAAVSLTHEQALIEYDPSVTRAEHLLQTLQDIGYTVSDPRKLRPFEEQERALVRERWRFLTALTTSIAAMGLVGYPVGSRWFALCVFSIASLVALAFVVLRGYGTRTAVLGSALLAAFGTIIYYYQLHGPFGPAVPWAAGLFAVVVTFGVGAHIVRMAYMALGRGILNQNSVRHCQMPAPPHSWSRSSPACWRAPCVPALFLWGSASQPLRAERKLRHAGAAFSLRSHSLLASS